jgi:hypothetical protein
MQRDIKEEAAVLLTKLTGNVIRSGAASPPLRSSPTHGSPRSSGTQPHTGSIGSLVRQRAAELEGLRGGLAERSPSPLHSAMQRSPSPLTAPLMAEVGLEEPLNACVAQSPTTVCGAEEAPPAPLWKAGQSALPIMSPSRSQPPSRKGAHLPSLQVRQSPVRNPPGPHRQPPLGPPLPPLQELHPQHSMTLHRHSTSERASPTRQAKPPRGALSPLRGADSQQQQQHQHQQQHQQAAAQLGSREVGAQAEEGDQCDSPLGSVDGDGSPLNLWEQQLRQQAAARRLYQRTLQAEREGSLSPPRGAAGEGSQPQGSPGRRYPTLNPAQLALLRRTLHSHDSADALLEQLGSGSIHSRSPEGRRQRSKSPAGPLTGASSTWDLLAAQHELALRAREAVHGAHAAPPPLLESSSPQQQQQQQKQQSPPMKRGPPIESLHAFPDLVLDDVARIAAEARGRTPQRSLRYAPPSPLRALPSDAPLLSLHRPAASGSGSGSGGEALQPRKGGQRQSPAAPAQQQHQQQKPVQPPLASIPALSGIQVQALLRPPPVPLAPPEAARRPQAGGARGPAASEGGATSSRQQRGGEGSAEKDISALLKSPVKAGGGLQGQLAKLMQLVGSSSGDSDSESEEDEEE